MQVRGTIETSRVSEPFLNPEVVNPVSPTSELGEPSTQVEESTPVPPYSVPVAGGYAYVCGTGHAHVSYGAAEQCERPVEAPSGAPTVKVTLRGPAPYGGSYTSTQDDPTVERLIAAGYTISRTWTVAR